MKPRVCLLLSMVLILLYSCKTDKQEQKQQEDKTKKIERKTLSKLNPRLSPRITYAEFEMKGNLQVAALNKKRVLFYDDKTPITLDELINAVYFAVCQANINAEAILKDTLIKVREIDLEVATDYSLIKNWNVQIGSSDKNVQLGGQPNTTQSWKSDFTMIPVTDKKKMAKLPDPIKDSKERKAKLASQEQNLDDIKIKDGEVYDSLTYYYANITDGDYSKQISRLTNQRAKTKVTIDSLQQIINAYRFGREFQDALISSTENAIAMYARLSQQPSKLPTSKCFSIEYGLQTTTDTNGKFTFSILIFSFTGGAEKKNSKTHKIVLKFSDGVTKDCN